MKSGIYRIRNTTNDDCYIGSSYDLSRRNKDHWRLLKKGNSHNILLQRAWNKYGENSFVFEILAKCPKEYLFKLEQWFVDTIDPKYNVCKEDVSVPIGLRHYGYSEREQYKEIAKERIKNNPKFGWKSRVILQMSDTGEILKEYASLKEYATEHHCAIGNVGKALKEGNRCKGFYVKYKD